VTSRVITLKPASVHGPNEVTIATSVASRPRHKDSTGALPSPCRAARRRARIGKHVTAQALRHSLPLIFLRADLKFGSSRTAFRIALGHRSMSWS